MKLFCSDHKEHCISTKEDPTLKHVEDDKYCTSLFFVLYHDKRGSVYSGVEIVDTILNTDWELDT